MNLPFPKACAAAACALLAGLPAGCALPLRIDSQPQGAVVCIDGREVGRTPMDTELPWNSGWISVQAPGYRIDHVEWTNHYVGQMHMVPNVPVLLFELKRKTYGMGPDAALPPGARMPASLPSAPAAAPTPFNTRPPSSGFRGVLK